MAMAICIETPCMRSSCLGHLYCHCYARRTALVVLAIVMHSGATRSSLQTEGQAVETENYPFRQFRTSFKVAFRVNKPRFASPPLDLSHFLLTTTRCFQLLYKQQEQVSEHSRNRTPCPRSPR